MPSMVRARAEIHCCCPIFYASLAAPTMVCSDKTLIGVTYDVLTGKGGGTPKVDDSTDKLRDINKGERVKKFENFADV